MKCVNFTVRSRKYQKFFYCRKLKKEIEISQCKYCNDTEFREIKIKKYSHKISKRAKACEISLKTKEIVYERDNHRCVFCGKNVDKSNACCHLIPRSQGGLGVEENIFTACEDCHREQDNGLNSLEYERKAEEYLKNLYPEWNKDKLIYKKY